MTFNPDTWSARRRKNKAQMSFAQSTMNHREHVMAWMIHRCMAPLMPIKAKVWLKHK
jgi:hypothetical protein